MVKHNDVGNKRLLFVATRQFWPVTTGHEIMLYNTCQGLHEKCGYSIYLFCFADKTTEKSRKLPAFIKEVIYADVPGKAIVFPGVLMNLLHIKAQPFQNTLFYSKGIERKLLSYCDTLKPDVLYIDMMRLVPYTEKLRNNVAVMILNAEDNLAKRYQRQLNSSSVGNLAGYFSNNMSGILKKIVSAEFLKQIILKLEIGRLEQYEQVCVRNFDAITFISAIETEEFNQRHSTNKAVTLTIGADISYYSQEVDVEKKSNTLVYVGNFSYAPNAASIRMIATEIMPKLPQNVKLKVVGICPDDVRKDIEGPQLEVLGFVDDIRAEVKSATVYLSPIAYGSGIKTKIIEAMAMSMPVVTNSVGAESLNVTSGKELFIIDDIPGIVDKVRELLTNSAQCEKIGLAGQKYIKENHSWDRVYKAFDRMGL